MKESYISEVDILDESKECFLTYAEEVLTDRAIPAAEDGLLSAQRKILWTMEDYLKMASNGKTKKCNAIVGSTLATSYFHGDQACYGVLCKMSQDYLMRYPLITGQGSLGTQESNDMVASSRYTEAKPSKFADIMMTDFKKNVVPLKETYNGEFMEPVVLPGLFPNALCNGRQAIGISMAHNSLPHNLTEVCNAIIAYIEKGSLTIDEVMEYIKGPDFPLKNTIINKNDIKLALMTGKSNTSLKVRGEYEIKGQDIIFTTIPYRTYRNKIKEQITKNIDELEKVIDDFDDESGLGNNRLIFHVKKGVEPMIAVRQLFALTDLQTTVSYNMNYIVNGTPKLCSIIDLIKSYYEHQTNVLLRSTQFDLDKAAARAHVLEGLLLILTNIDKAISLIRNSNDRKEAEAALVKEFNLDDIQAKAVLEMKLAKLTKLDKDDLVKELEEKKAIIAECEKIINDEVYRNSKLIEKIEWLRDKYGDARRTELAQIDEPKTKAEKEIKEVIPEDVVVVTTKSGLIKRIPRASFKSQKRGGKGVKSTDDILLDVVNTNTIDTMMFFTDKGKMYRCVVDKIPTGTNTTKGGLVSDLIDMDKDETVVAATSLRRKSIPKYVIFITKKGMVKKTYLSEYETNRNKGIKAIKLADDDKLVDIIFQDDEELMLFTKNGYCIRFDSTLVSPVGKIAMGVKGIKLSDDDEVVAGLPVHKQDDNIAIITETGLIKKMNVQEFPLQTRAGKGTIYYKPTEQTGNIVTCAMVDDDDNVLICGTVNNICFSVTEIPQVGKLAMGVQTLKRGKVTGMTKI